MLAPLLYKELEKIHTHQAWTKLEKVDRLYRLLNLIFVESTRRERLHFTTLFARIAYTCHKYELSKQQQFWIHRFRKIARGWMGTPKASPNASGLQSDYDLGLKVVSDVIEKVFQVAPPQHLAKALPKKIPYAFKPSEVKAFESQVRVVVLEIDAAKEQLIAKAETAPEENIRIQYNIGERNENFNPTINVLQAHFALPVSMNLLDVEIDKEGTYRPRAFVLEPDYLVDVSAVAECFKSFGTEPLTYLLKKFLPFQVSKHLMLGNIANFFLDEILSNPEVTFKEIFPKVFQLNPLAFAMMDNRLVKEIMGTSQRHYVNLKKIISQDFPKFGIEPQHCYLEPTFYTSAYGLQGRLDIFYKHEKAAIIELKSGKAYRPNKHGISHNHYTQTLLYDLMIKSVFGKETDPTNYILYSGVENNHLRFAPAVKAQQFEAIQARNQLVALERQLLQSGQQNDNKLFTKLKANAVHPHAGFLKRDIGAFEKLYNGVSELERSYFNAFAGFIAREHQLAKTGIEGLEDINGQAALWLDAFQTKQERYDVLSYLKITEQKTNEAEPILAFAKSDETNPLANFRVGDIAVLYAFDDEKASPLNKQLFKCTIVELTKESIKVRLRSKQFNPSVFESDGYWNLEHDLLDSGFNAMYRSLYKFLLSSVEKKQLLLTSKAPQKAQLMIHPMPSELTEEQQGILQQIISAKDYFLLWGPPGTGKTSMMLKHLVDHLLNNTNENILLLAYTNRAVDEICESIEQIGDYIKEQYVRIGSKYSSGASFHDQLLTEKTAQVKSRKDLRGIIEKHRIFVSTVASISNKPELLAMKQFNTAIIDEASQILEPILVGLLPNFNRFVLIGDHKQLPAVVVQSEEASAVQNEKLKAIGLDNLRNSLFERLYHTCQNQEWDWAYAQLSHQGRMHREIMDFPNTAFYESNLKILPAELLQHQFQIEQLNYANIENGSNEMIALLCKKRKNFFPTPIDSKSANHKTNQHEAQLVAQLVKSFQAIYANNSSTCGEFTKNTLGIITPFRAQIATIRHELNEQGFDPEQITIDTVERYQGGARDIIIISLCTNKLSQLSAISSFSKDGKVDRKLNVALTRARKHLVILGNEEILKTNKVYRALIEDASLELKMEN